MLADAHTVAVVAVVALVFMAKVLAGRRQVEAAVLVAMQGPAVQMEETLGQQRHILEATVALMVVEPELVASSSALQTMPEELREAALCGLFIAVVALVALHRSLQQM